MCAKIKLHILYGMKVACSILELKLVWVHKKLFTIYLEEGFVQLLPISACDFAQIIFFGPIVYLSLTPLP